MDFVNIYRGWTRICIEAKIFFFYFFKYFLSPLFCPSPSLFLFSLFPFIYVLFNTKYQLNNWINIGHSAYVDSELPKEANIKYWGANWKAFGAINRNRIYQKLCIQLNLKYTLTSKFQLRLCNIIVPSISKLRGVN